MPATHMDEPMCHSDEEKNRHAKCQYLGDTSDNLVKQLHPLQKNAPRILECLYFGDNVCSSIDSRVHQAGNWWRGAECADPFVRVSDGIASLKLVCVNTLARLNSQRKLDRHSRRIGPIGGILSKILFKHFDRRDRVSTTCHKRLELRTAILQLSQYPTNGISETCNRCILSKAVLPVNLDDEVGMVVQITDKSQSLGDKQ